MRVLVVAALTSVSLALAAMAAPTAKTPGKPAQPVAPRQLPGWGLYDRYCLACHGSAGDGSGPAAPFTWPRPRDFTLGAYHWRSTSVGESPTDDDLRATIRFGAIGTSMHGFDGILSATEVDQLVAIVKAFAPHTFGKAGKTVALAPPTTAPNTARGAQLFTEQGCARCHAAGGYDLATRPVKRPRKLDATDSEKREAIAVSIATGLAGTPMPGYAGTLSDADIWNLAEHVLALSAAAPRATAATRSVLDRETVDRDRNAQITSGTWPGSDPDEARVFGAPVPEQGPVPSSLAPAQASLSAKQCARCHAKQEREWRGSVHAAASTWGLPARELDHVTDGDDSCNRCHTPLAEQQPGSASFDAALRNEGVQCGGCHLRNWERRGPPRRAASLLPSASYPLVELAIYERSDFCVGCHQLPPRTAVNGKPLLNTYKEWLEGPYMPRGVQCQHCHMPNREHTWLGIHDRDTVRQGIKLAATAHAKDGRVSVTATLANVGAGHYLPTTPTPAVWLRIELLDNKGRAILGARDTVRIGRDIAFVTQGGSGTWQERADTRIPPGEHATMTRAWKGGRTAEAAIARVTVEVSPDDFYERMYTGRLAAQLPAATRTAYEAALARAKAAHYVAEQLDIAISSKR